jgi:2-keto-3-deoxy-L-rhamnonate aldolase RhmA
MRTNATKERIRAGGVAFGVICGVPSEAIVELVGHAGFDFVFIDGEHAPLSEETCERLVRAAEVAGITPVVRVAGNDPKLILRVLDSGALGVMVPHVNTAEDALAAVRAAKYFPQGSRGLGPVRAAGYGETVSMEKYTEEANQQTLVAVQIEDIAALPNLTDIVAVEGVDVVALGQRDLSTSMGFPGQYDQPEVRKAMDEVIEVVNASDKALSLGASDGASAARAIERGAQFIAVGLAPLLTKAGRALLQEAGGSRTQPMR